MYVGVCVFVLARNIMPKSLIAHNASTENLSFTHFSPQIHRVESVRSA